MPRRPSCTSSSPHGSATRCPSSRRSSAGCARRVRAESRASRRKGHERRPSLASKEPYDRRPGGDGDADVRDHHPRGPRAAPPRRPRARRAPSPRAEHARGGVVGRLLRGPRPRVRRRAAGGGGGDKAGEFLAGWATEYSLSVDNLFVFVIIMSRFAVPRNNQQKVLIVGIILSLLLRGACILLGAAAIEAFSWVFYLFGGFLVYTAVQLLSYHGPTEQEYRDSALIRHARKVLPITETYDGARLLTRVGRRRMLTPMVVVLLAIGSTDVLFALDSIPAIFGLTQDPFVVFTATLFALMGLRQL